jgi:hypothetical protein
MVNIVHSWGLPQFANLPVVQEKGLGFKNWATVYQHPTAHHEGWMDGWMDG